MSTDPQNGDAASLKPATPATPAKIPTTPAGIPQYPRVILVRKTGDPELSINDRTTLDKLTITSTGKDTWKITIDSAAESSFATLTENDRILAEWEEKSGEKVITSKGVSGVKKGNEITGLKRSSYVVNMRAQMEIKQPGAIYPAGKLAVMVGNAMPDSPKGEWVIRSIDDSPSYIDLVAAINWIKGQDSSASGLDLPKAPGKINNMDYSVFLNDAYIKAIYPATANANDKATALGKFGPLLSHIENEFKLADLQSGDDKKKKEIANRDVTSFCSQLSVKLVAAGKIEGSNIAAGNTVLVNLVTEAINAKFGEGFLPASAISISALERFQIMFQYFSYNISTGLLTVDLQSNPSQELKFGPFTLKEVGLYVSNDPERIEKKFPQLALKA